MKGVHAHACLVKLVLLIMVLCVHAGEVVHIDLDWIGGEDHCDCTAVAGDDYACDSGDGVWNNGMNHFVDTQPAFRKLTQVVVEIFGSFDCNYSRTLQISVNNGPQPFAVVDIPRNDDPMCNICGNCFSAMAPISYTSQIYMDGWPGYVSGFKNNVTLLLDGTQGTAKSRFCIADIALTMIYNDTSGTLDSSSSSSEINIDAPLWFWSLVSAAGIVVVVLIVMFFFLWRRSSSRAQKYNNMGYRKMQNNNEYKDPRQLEEISIDMSKITIEGEIGRGSFGLVCRGNWRGTEVAVKRLPSSSMNDEQTLMEFMKEAFIMQKLRHPNVLQVLGVCLEPPCIVMEFMPRGSLYQLAHNPHTHVDWPTMKRMAVDVCRGMSYLHGCNPPLIHRDLKPHNLLVDDNWRVKVCDFGLSRFMEVKKNMTACGTPAYAAPEVLRNSSYSTSADVYSFGVVLWELITRETPYPDMPPFQIIFSVGTQKLRPIIPASCPTALTRLIEDCWEEDATKRPTFLTLAERISAMTENMSVSWSRFTKTMSRS